MRMAYMLFNEYLIVFFVLFHPHLLLAKDSVGDTTLVSNSNITPTIKNINPIPNPLSLEKALQFGGLDHPDILLAKAQVEEAQAQLLQVQAKLGINSFIDLSAQRLVLSTTGEIVNDNYSRLVVNKTLYDFGRTSALEDSRAANVTSREYLLLDAKQQHRLEIMKRFFDVLLADTRYSVDNEEMVQRYLKYDKIKERFNQGIKSPVELNKAENYYREAYDVRDASEKNQHSTRLLLALSLNHPEQLPAELEPPDLSRIPEKIPEIASIFKQAMNSNPAILSLQQEVEAARNQVTAARARYRPILTAEIQIADYQRTLSSRGDYLAALTLTLPIYQGNQTQAEIAHATANLSLKIAQLKKAEQILLQTLSSLVKELEILKTKYKTAQQRVKYRDLNLEYNRALYELEIQSNLSDAQARITEAQWLADKVNYDTALTWARLNSLLGKSLIQQDEVPSP